METEDGVNDLRNRLKKISSKVRENAKSNALADTADILGCANTLWNEYLENSASLTHDQWEFLGSKLDTLNIDEPAKQEFCNHRSENDTEAVAVLIEEDIDDIKSLWGKYISNLKSLRHDEREILEQNLEKLKISDSAKIVFWQWKAECDKRSDKKITIAPQASPVADFQNMLRHIMSSDVSMDEVGKNILEIKNKLTLSDADLTQCISIVSSWMQWPQDSRWFDTLLEIFEAEVEKNKKPNN